jgi:anaerobic dimethyl sulfoxide reductase subunit B (iron-sulfur subunit)
LIAPTFVIDLSRCTGCHACQVACKDRADLADELDWLHVEAHEGGEYPTPTLTYRVVHCFHCAEPACAAVCPVEALVQDPLGLIQIDAELCIGCEECVEACPFEAIFMGSGDVASKCDGCAPEVVQGWDPTCVRACPTRALGLLPGDSASAPAGRTADARFDDHGLRPRVVYLAQRRQ